MAKDLRLLKSECSSSSLPFLTELQAIFIQAQEAGFFEEDFSKIIELCG